MAAQKDHDVDRITIGEDMTIYHAATQKQALIDALKASTRKQQADPCGVMFHEPSSLICCRRTVRRVLS